MAYETCIFENRSYYTADIYMVTKSCWPIPALLIDIACTLSSQPLRQNYQRVYSTLDQ